jgi:hypothetical protein
VAAVQRHNLTSSVLASTFSREISREVGRYYIVRKRRCVKCEWSQPAHDSLLLTTLQFEVMLPDSCLVPCICSCRVISILAAMKMSIVLS